MKLKDLMERVADILPTTTDVGHSHYVSVDKNGDGFTTNTSKGFEHNHKVKNWKALPSEKDGHIHEVKKPNRRKNIT